MRLRPEAEEVIRKAVENVGWLFVSRATKKDPHVVNRKFGWRIKDIAKRFVAFLNEGLDKGDAAWL